MTGLPGTRWGDDYYAAVINGAQAAVRSRTRWIGPDGMTCVAVASVPISAGRTRGVPSRLTAAGRPVNASLDASLRPKLHKQLPGAKARRRHVVVLLDQAGDDTSKEVPMFVPPPRSITTATQRLLDQHPGLDDEVWLRDAELRLHRLIGDV